MEPLDILVTQSFDFKVGEKQTQQIREVAPHAEFVITKIGDDTKEQLDWAEIVFGWPNRQYLPETKKLRWIQLHSSGSDRYADRRLYPRGGVRVTNCSGVFGEPIAEYVIGTILAFNKNLMFYMKNKDASQWLRDVQQRDFFNSTIGLLGLGDIGTEVAKRAKALGARVLAMRRRKTEKPAYVDELYGEDGIGSLLAQADVVVVALPNTPNTKEVINAETLGMMKPNSLLVNVSRGDLVDQDALIGALRAKKIGGAVLDVTTPEPLPPESPLWYLDNVIITPHSSAFSSTNIDRRMAIFLDNLKRYLTGQELTHPVDLDAGY